MWTFSRTNASYEKGNTVSTRYVPNEEFRSVTIGGAYIYLTLGSERLIGMKIRLRY
jgi:hypothetical protein